MKSSKTKVLYISGWGRSGSTILGNILGQIEGFFNVGEFCQIWDHSLISNNLCGCGVQFKECVVWRAVLNKAFGGMDRVNSHYMIRLRERRPRTHHIPLIISLPGGKTRLKSRLGNYLASVENLYSAIRDVTGSRVIVDSSKYPSYAFMIGMMPTIDIYLVHLVRDPRGVAYSWLRRKFRPDSGNYMSRINPVRSSLSWNARNIVAEMLGKKLHERYLRLRYEDFVADPLESVRRVLNLVQEGVPYLPFITDDKVELIETSHTIWGNANRLQTGMVKLEPDDIWKSEMGRKDKLTVTAITWPLLLRYGYSTKI